MKTKLFVLFIFIVFGIQIYQLNYTGHNYYTTKLKEKTERIVYGESAPRGRILDRNGKVLVDNVGVLNIIYHKPNRITISEELQMAKILAQYEQNISLTTTDLKNYYLANNNNGKDLITEDEWRLYEERKLTDEDISSLKWDRITKEMLNYTEEEQKIATIFTKMQNGYIYQDKILFNDVSNDFVSQILGLNIEALSVKVSSKRTYPYGETLRTIFGGVGAITKETQEKYLSQNYALSDKVGTSGLEEEYENILKGKKAVYYINSDNSLTLIEEAEQGSDLVLNIDIDLQLELEKTLKEEMISAKKRQTASYFNEAYAMIGDPKTGGILAIA